MRRQILLATLMLSLGISVSAREFKHYETQPIVIVSRSPEGKKLVRIDMDYLDATLRNMAAQANRYPPQFDTPQDKERALKDVRDLVGLMSLLVDASPSNTDLLFRAARTFGMAHNMDVPGTAEKADELFRQLLDLEPTHPQGNFQYGAFLAGVGQPRMALPYLDKALSLGVTDADYSLGLTHLSLGDKARALQHLQAFKRRQPRNTEVDTLMDAIQSGRTEVRKSAL